MDRYIAPFMPSNHYWVRVDGKVFSSARCAEYEAEDGIYQAWLAEGRLPTKYPCDELGNESVAELAKVLAVHGLRASPLTQTEKRKKAFAEEADVLRDEISGYREEAAARRQVGDDAGAVKVEDWARAKRVRWLEIREEIRERFPDDVYRISSSGVYHLPTCSYAGDNGEALTLASIRSSRPDAKACLRCNPPAVEVSADE